MMKQVLRLTVKDETDLVLVYNRCMKLAELCYFPLSVQTNFATAVSEIAKCANEHGKTARLQLGIDAIKNNDTCMIAVISGDIDFCLKDQSIMDLVGRLVEDVKTQSKANNSRVVLCQQIAFPSIITDKKAAGFAEYFKKEQPLSLYEELKQKNIQLQQLADRLRENEKDYRKLTNKLPLMMFMLNMHGDMIFANKRLREYFGLDEKPMIKFDLIHFVDTDEPDQLCKSWEKSFMRGKEFRVQVKLKYIPPGKDGWHMISISPTRNQVKEITGWTGFFVDINAQKIAEQTLQDNSDLKKMQHELQVKIDELNRSNDELEQFAYIASHDLQEPLRKIRTFSAMINNHPNDAKKNKAYYEKINKSADRMSTMIKDVLNYSRIARRDEQFQEVDLNDILKNSLNDLELMIAEKKALITHSKLAVVRGIPSQLQQLFYNLLINAMKFSQKKPLIHVTHKIIPAKKIRQKIKNDHYGKYIEITFKDNGIGFEQQYADKIFGIFQRLHRKESFEGTGIGLSICKRITENHEGFIRAESTPRKGSKFFVYLPMK